MKSVTVCTYLPSSGGSRFTASLSSRMLQAGIGRNWMKHPGLGLAHTCNEVPEGFRPQVLSRENLNSRGIRLSSYTHLGVVVEKK